MPGGAGCPASFNVVMVGRELGDPARAKEAVARELARLGCRVVEAPSWIAACCGGASVRGYAVLDGAAPGVPPRFHVDVSGACEEGLRIVSAVLDVAVSLGQAPLLEGQEDLFKGPRGLP